MKSILTVLAVLSGLTAFSQHEHFTDPRDRQEYHIVPIGGLYWFSENLRFVTERSWCGENTDHDLCAHSNYYYYNDLENVCPTGWRLPTWQDWQQAVSVFEAQRGIQAKVDTSTINKASIVVSGLNLYTDSLGLKLSSAGWLEGNNPKNASDPEKYPATVVWVTDPKTEDPTTHIHVTGFQFTKHAHDHNIIDELDVTRRFTVRCVKPRKP